MKEWVFDNYCVEIVWIGHGVRIYVTSRVGKLAMMIEYVKRKNSNFLHITRYGDMVLNMVKFGWKEMEVLMEDVEERIEKEGLKVIDEIVSKACGEISRWRV